MLVVSLLALSQVKNLGPQVARVVGSNHRHLQQASPWATIKAMCDSSGEATVAMVLTQVINQVPELSGLSATGMARCLCSPSVSAGALDGILGGGATDPSPESVTTALDELCVPECTQLLEVMIAQTEFGNAMMRGGVDANSFAPEAVACTCRNPVKVMAPIILFNYSLGMPSQGAVQDLCGISDQCVHLVSDLETANVVTESCPASSSWKWMWTDYFPLGFGWKWKGGSMWNWGWDSQGPGFSWVWGRRA